VQSVQAAQQAAIPLATLVQLYAPLVGLLGLAFWSGILTQRLSDTLRRVMKLEAASDGDITVAVDLGRIDQRLQNLETNYGHVSRDIGTIQRTLANLATGRIGPITKFEQD
jgi:hypothetical protein